jgi:hypothetical protein
LSSSDVGAWIQGAVLATVPVVLFFVGYVLSPEAPAERLTTLRGNGVTLSYDAGWTPDVGRNGLRHRNGGELRIGAARPGDLPGAPRLVEVAGQPAAAYRDGSSQTFVFTLGDGSRLAIACRNGNGSDVCAPLLASARVDGVVDPAPGPELAADLRSALAAVDATGRGARHGLGSRAVRERAIAAKHLATAYERLGRAVTRLAGRQRTRPDAEALGAVATAAARLAGAYHRLAPAALRRARPGYARARRRVGRSAAGLRTALTGLRARGYDVGRSTR